MLQQAQFDKKISLPVSSNLFVTRIARSITHVTAPPVLAVPTLIFLETFYDQQPTDTGWKIAIAVFFGAIAPALAVLTLKAFGLVSDIHIMDRKQRTLPYSIAIVSFALGAVLLYALYGWGLLPTLMTGSALTTLVVLFINLHWKISAHATGASSSIAACVLVAGWRALPLLSVLGLVAWARIYLRAHTPGQVATGTLLGFSFTMLLLTLSGSVM